MAEPLAGSDTLFHSRSAVASRSRPRGTDSSSGPKVVTNGGFDGHGGPLPGAATFVAAAAEGCLQLLLNNPR